LERPEVGVIGGGVVGAAVTLALARRGVDTLLLEAESDLALGASGTNSGILHTGFDSTPGTLETRLILRAAELREEVLPALGVPVIRCGALVGREHERVALEELAQRAEENGVHLEWREDRLFVPGEAVTDPVRYTLALARAAERLGARVVCGARVERIEDGGGVTLGRDGGDLARCRVAVNCAGLFADEVAHAAGDGDFRIRPRKGEFVVLEPRRTMPPWERILLPVPTARTKGVLVFPSVDGRVIAGPTARDQDDKRDWSVDPGVEEELVAQARAIAPALAEYEQVASYAGLRPAGAAGENYVIERSEACRHLVHVAAIRSTGLSASLGIAEHVVGLVEAAGVNLGEEQPVPAVEPIELPEPWWRRSAEYWS
jgi:glycerol-3-phosphate dehydrogenase